MDATHTLIGLNFGRSSMPTRNTSELTSDDAPELIVDDAKRKETPFLSTSLLCRFFYRYAYPTSTVVVATTLVGSVCSGSSIPTASGSSSNTNVGQYNFQKISFGNYTYEVECYQGLGGGTVSAQIPSSLGSYPNPSSLEGCINYCNTWQNTNGPGTCSGVTFIPSGPNTCYMVISTSSPGAVQSPPSAAIAFGSLSAKLIYSQYSLVIDASYLLPTPTASNLGLCLSVGPSPTLSAYAFQPIAPQMTNGVYVSGSSGGTGGRVYENECGRLYPTLGPVVPATASYSTTLFGANGPQSPEDCMRYCDLNNYYNSATPTTRCAYYVWQISVKMCTLYTSGSGTVTMNSDYVAGILQSYSNNFLGDRSSGFGYKRMVNPPKRVRQAPGMRKPT